MKLLFDHNLSPKLITALADIFPGSNHVFPLGLAEARDLEVRGFAAENGFLVVTKDADYSELHSLLGAPPKVVWIRRGNCSTKAIEDLLRTNLTLIQTLEADPNSGVLTIF
jgi:predicted nuclease of predicted toxin-antitoxin system